jgi:thymidylate synthase (FAD)
LNSAKIIAITQPLIDVNGALPNNDRDRLTVDEFVAYVARVSNPTNQGNKLTAKKLLKYLIKNKHWSPFEMVHAVGDVNTTRDIGRQILRHRSFSFQEFSQRYADPTKMEFVLREARLQDKTNRQASIKIDNKELHTEWNFIQKELIEKAKEAYDWAIENGIAKEQARAALPEGLTPTHIYMAGSLRSWVHWCALRGWGHSVDPVTGEKKLSTQQEHIDLAREAWENLVDHFPSLSDIDMETV